MLDYSYAGTPLTVKGNDGDVLAHPCLLIKSLRKRIMSKKAFIEHICANFECNKEAANTVVEIFKESVLSAISEGIPIHIDGLGSFKISHQPARSIYNSRTGNIVKVPSYCKPHFVPAKEFKELKYAVK